MDKPQRVYAKRRFTLVFLLIVTVAGLLAGCGQKQARTKPPVPEPVACVIMIDGTGSYEHLDKAKHTARKVIAELPAGSRVYVRWITENSQSDRRGIVSTQLPRIEKPKNSFDLREKQRYTTAVTRIRKQRQEIFDALSAAASPRAMRTDIYGALAAASVRFDGSIEMKPLLIMMTDMVDNVRNSHIEVNLKNARVKILDFQVGSNDAELKSNWRQYLSSHGASGVDFAHLDDPYKGGK